MTDVISFIVDRKVVYLDTNEVTDDLPLLMVAAEQKGTLAKPFKEMHLVLSHREGGLHVLIDVRIHSRVMLGEEEMRADLSARVEELRIHPGESAADYRARIEAFVADGTRAEADRVALDQLTRRIAVCLDRTLVGARATAQPATLQIIAPGQQQLARFRNLPFGDDVESPHYRAVPTYQRAGAYADPFYYYYYDPYYDLMNWVMLDAMLHTQAWHSPSVYVVDPGGNFLGTGATIDAATANWAGRDAVGFDDGGVTVADSIPAAGGDSGDGSPGDGAWGSSDTGSSDWTSSDSASDSSSSDSSSSCSSSDGGSSSCGSSCSSGSSCGSSCGGGSSD